MPGNSDISQDSTEPTQITEAYLDELMLRLDLAIIQQKVLDEMYDELQIRVREFFGKDT